MRVQESSGALSDHGGRSIETDDLCAALRHFCRQVTGTASEVQYPLAGLGIEKADQVLPILRLGDSIHPDR